MGYPNDDRVSQELIYAPGIELFPTIFAHMALRVAYAYAYLASGVLASGFDPTGADSLSSITLDMRADGVSVFAQPLMLSTDEQIGVRVAAALQRRTRNIAKDAKITFHYAAVGNGAAATSTVTFVIGLDRVGR